MVEYVSPRDLGRAVGLSESSVRRWADDGRLRAERTAGGHRRIARAEAVRFIRDAGLALLRPDLLGFPTARAAAGGRVPSAESLLEALEASDPVAVRRMLVAAFLEGAPLPALCDGPIRLVLEALGEPAQRPPERVVVEYRAVDAFLHALLEIRATLPVRRGAPVALGGAVSGAPYVLPTLMVAVVLADVGFRALNLGPHVPTRALLAAVRRHRPELVWRSAATSDARAWLRREGRHLAGGPAFVVGGPGVGAGDLPPDTGVHLRSMSELAGFARALL